MSNKLGEDGNNKQATIAPIGTGITDGKTTMPPLLEEVFKKYITNVRYKAKGSQLPSNHAASVKSALEKSDDFLRDALFVEFWEYFGVRGTRVDANVIALHTMVRRARSLVKRLRNIYEMLAISCADITNGTTDEKNAFSIIKNTVFMYNDIDKMERACGRVEEACAFNYTDTEYDALARNMKNNADSDKHEYEMTLCYRMYGDDLESIPRRYMTMNLFTKVIEYAHKRRLQGHKERPFFQTPDLLLGTAWVFGKNLQERDAMISKFKSATGWQIERKRGGITIITIGLDGSETKKEANTFAVVGIYANRTYNSRGPWRYRNDEWMKFLTINSKLSEKISSATAEKSKTASTKATEAPKTRNDFDNYADVCLGLFGNDIKPLRALNSSDMYMFKPSIDAVRVAAKMYSVLRDEAYDMTMEKNLYPLARYEKVLSKSVAFNRSGTEKQNILHKFQMEDQVYDDDSMRLEFQEADTLFYSAVHDEFVGAGNDMTQEEAADKLYSTVLNLFSDPIRTSTMFYSGAKIHEAFLDPKPSFVESENVLKKYEEQETYKNTRNSNVCSCIRHLLSLIKRVDNEDNVMQEAFGKILEASKMMPATYNEIWTYITALQKEKKTQEKEDIRKTLAAKLSAHLVSKQLASIDGASKEIANIIFSPQSTFKKGRASNNSLEKTLSDVLDSVFFSPHLAGMIRYMRQPGYKYIPGGDPVLLAFMSRCMEIKPDLLPFHCRCLAYLSRQSDCLPNASTMIATSAKLAGNEKKRTETTGSEQSIIDEVDVQECDEIRKFFSVTTKSETLTRFERDLIRTTDDNTVDGVFSFTPDQMNRIENTTVPMLFKMLGITRMDIMKAVASKEGLANTINGNRYLFEEVSLGIGSENKINKFGVIVHHYSRRSDAQSSGNNDKNNATTNVQRDDDNDKVLVRYAEDPDPKRNYTVPFNYIVIPLHNLHVSTAKRIVDKRLQPAK